MPDHLPTGTVTFLFTDIEGSTPLWEHEREQMRAALQRHHAILQKCIGANSGHVYKIIGDAFQAAFAVAHHAVNAAIAAQRELASEAWPTSVPLRVRMGLHAGDAIADAQADDYVTTHTLNRVARIMSAAHGGQILLSDTVADLASGHLPDGVELQDMGRHRMKGLTQLEHLYQVLAPDLPSHFPALNTLNVSSNNLPTQLTTFIGREREVAQVKRLLLESRLITLTGSGGCGKTRLSIQVATQVRAAYAHGVWLAELAPLADPALVPQSVVATLGLREDSHRSTLEVLTNYLRPKKLLLLLDNCEHVIEACAQLSDALLRACPDLRILASSREALGIAGEAPYRVPSLAMPGAEHLPALETLAGMDAIRLFVERALTAKADFALTTHNAQPIAQICRRLDGIPLAIELAASRIKMLSVEQIAARLDDRFRLLTGGSRTALPRQQTLRALIDWSYSLLSEQERVVFRRLAVFVGGWTLEAAESVCSGDGIEAYAVLDLLTRLVDKSLVTMEERADETRYHRLETIRQYSREKFFETDEVETVRDGHLEFYVQFAETADERMQSRERSAWTRRLETEQDNLRAALEWGLARNPDSALRIAAAMHLFWSAGGYSAEGYRWTQQALERVEATSPLEGAELQQRLVAQAKGLRGLSWLHTSQGDNLNACLVAEQSIALYRQAADVDRAGLALALIMLAMPLEFLGKRSEAETLLKESIALARVAGNVFVSSMALGSLARVTAHLYDDLDAARAYVDEGMRISRQAGLDWPAATLAEMLGVIAVRRKDYVEARARFEEALMAHEALGAHFNILLGKSNLAHLERSQGNYAQALELYRETIVGFRDVAQLGAVAHQLECFGFIAFAQNQFEHAARLLAAAEALRERSSTPMTPDEQIEYQQQVDLVREQIQPELFTKIWAAGRALTMEQAIEYATETHNPTP